MTEVKQRSMRVVAGVGREYVLPEDVVSRYANDDVEHAIRGLIQEEIKDEELLELIDDRRTAIELFAEGDDGHVHEEPLSRRDPFQRVLDRLDGKECEVAMARTHRGGNRIARPSHG